MKHEVKKPWQHPPIRSPVTGEAGKWQSTAGRDVFTPIGEMDADEVGQDELERWLHPPPSYAARSADSKPDPNPNEEVVKPGQIVPESSRSTPGSEVDEKLFGDPKENIGKEQGYGNLDSAFVQGRGEVDAEGLNSETYIGSHTNDGKREINMNKIKNTKIGDDIHFYINGVEGRGVVVKMGSSFVQVFKEDGTLSDIHINDTFYVKDILVNKTWDDMDNNERYEALQKIHAPSPRFLSKSWDQLPRELKELLTKTGFTYETGHSTGVESADHSRTGMQQKTQYDDQIKEKEENSSTGRATEGIGRNARFGQNQETKSESITKPIPDGKGGKGSFDECESKNQDKKNPGAFCGSMQNGVEGKDKSDVEDGTYGNAGRNPNAGVSTNTERTVDASEDYEGETHDEKETQFKHERLNPETKDAEFDAATGKKKDDGASTGDSAAFNAVYGPHTGKPGTDQKYGDKKSGITGVPDYNVNTWGINYSRKENKEEEKKDE